MANKGNGLGSSSLLPQDQEKTIGIGSKGKGDEVESGNQIGSKHTNKNSSEFTKVRRFWTLHQRIVDLRQF